MSTVVKTIKNYSTDDTIYPITKASAVYMGNSTIDTVESKITQLQENKLEKINPQIPYNISFLASTNNIHWGEVPSQYLSGNYIHFRDIDGVPIGQVHSFQNMNGDQGIRILGYMGDPNSTDPSSTYAYHGFSVGTRINGDPYFIPNGPNMTTAIWEGLQLDTIIKKVRIENISVNIPANGIALGAETNAISGYECLAAHFSDTTSSPSSSVFATPVFYQSSKYRVRFRNLATAAKTVTGTVVFYFIRTDFMTT